MTFPLGASRSLLKGFFGRSRLLKYIKYYYTFLFNFSGDSPIPMSTLGSSYVAATGGALGTALGLNAMVKSLPPLVGRFVPFAAVAAANCINIPLMRRSELQEVL